MSKGKLLKQQAQLQRAEAERKRREAAIARIAASPKVEHVKPDFHALGKLQRSAIGLASRGHVVEELRGASIDDQINVLNGQVAASRPDKLRQALISKSPREMDKGIKKLQKEGKAVTVDALCAEVKTTPGFLAMCERVGLNLAWFEKLAKERMEAHGL